MGAALAAGVADQAQEVHDRALLYYRQALGWRLLQAACHAGTAHTSFPSMLAMPAALTGIEVAGTD